MAKIYAQITNSESLKYRDISKLSYKQGWGVNHSSARNYLIRAMRKFAKQLTKKHELRYTRAQINEIATNPDFQEAISILIEKYS